MKIARIGIFLFSLPFVGFGIGFFALKVYPDLNDWYATKSWQAVDAQLLAATLKSNPSSKSTTYEATASYQYTFNGQNYSGNRVALATGADNIGSFQKELGRQLENSFRQKRPIQIWVNPQQPHQSVINRDMRWGLMSLKLIFVLAFGGIGGVFMFASFKTKGKKQAKTELTGDDDKPWVTNQAWSSPVILSSAKKMLWVMWGFAVFWNAITIPVAFQIPGGLEKGEYGVLAVLIFNVIGLVILILAVRQTLQWKKFGVTPLTMDPHPGAIGGQVGGHIDVKIPYSSRHDYKITLSNIHSYVSGSGKNRSRHESVQWQDILHVKGEPGSKGTRVSFCFNVPEGLRASELHSSNYYKWNLNMTVNLPGVDLDRNFEIPVFPTAEQSRYVDQDRLQIATEQEDLDLPYKVQQQFDTTQLYYPPGRSKGMALTLLVTGSIFFGVGVFLGIKFWSDNNPETMLFIMGSCFLLVGLLMELGGIYTLINSLQVTIDNTGIKTIRSLAGTPVFQRRVTRQEIRDIQTSRGAQSGNTVYYRLFIVTNDGRRIKVGESFVGASNAEKAVSQMKTWLEL